MDTPVRTVPEGNVAVIEIDNPPVNALSHPVRKGLADAIERAVADESVDALVLIGAGRCFSAGADITEFGKPRLEPTLREVHEIIERSPKPVIAAIHSFAFGGGLETALACHFRIATPDAKLALPEVKLGILPGAGGTQRLPRLVGVEKALEMICTGEPIEAREATERALICKLSTSGDLRADAVAFAHELLASGRPVIPVSRDDHLVREGARRPEVFQAAREYWARKRRGEIAPQHCITAVQAACELSFEAGMKRERELFEELVASEQSKALRHVFFAERAANKIPGVSRETPRRKVDSVAVIGAGTMGTGITMAFAAARIPVTLLEKDQPSLERGLGRIRETWERSARKGRFSEAEVEERLARIRPTLRLADLADVDLIIEAVFEDMDLKLEVFRNIDLHARPGAILATNTSTLDVNEIARATARPESVVGLHFFSPAHVMKLLEVVRGEKTAPEVMATAFDLARRIGKIPVQAGVCHGFIGNRMLHAYFNQAFALLYEGALPEQVDRALTDFGLKMGPFEMSDLAGLDVSWRVRKAEGREEPIADRLCEMGRFGQKTGAGYYRYRNGRRRPLPDPEVARIVEEEGLKRHGTRRSIGAEEIVERCLLALVNEGARILEEGIALRASDIDVVYVHGYGFPAWRGGPMFWADSLGLDHVLARLNHWHAQGQEVLAPAPLIERLAAEGSSFEALDAGQRSAAA